MPTFREKIISCETPAPADETPDNSCLLWQLSRVSISSTIQNILENTMYEIPRQTNIFDVILFLPANCIKIHHINQKPMI